MVQITSASYEFSIIREPKYIVGSDVPLSKKSPIRYPNVMETNFFIFFYKGIALLNNLVPFILNSEKN